MREASRRRGAVVKPWLIVTASLVIMGGLVWLLWNMNRPRPSGDRPKQLVLLCANGLLKPVEQIAARYKVEFGVEVIPRVNNSGGLLSDLRVAQNRADLFLAGEESFNREARAKGLVAEILPVVQQHVVLAVRPGNPKHIGGVKDLLAEGVRVALPNPEPTAAGRSAQRALAGSGDWEALLEQTKKFSAKVSLVGTVTDAALKVKTDAADAAMVWDATARQFDLAVVEVPAFKSQTTEHATIGVIAATADPTAALHFARYLTASDRGQPIFQEHHFEPLADADVWEDHPSLVFMAGAMLKPGIDDLVKSFSQREGVDINISYNGCGILVAEMKAMKKGEPRPTHFPDAYFSCDVSFMKQVQDWFEASKVITRNDMVLVVPKGNPKQVTSIKDLARADLRIGLGHPTNSALGALTDDLLKKLGLRDKVYEAERRTPIVHKDAGHDLVNSLRAGALDALIVYRSNVLSNPENAEKYLDIVEMNLPEAVARQPYAVAKDSRHKYLMGRLLDAVLSPASEKHFRAAGFQWIAEGEGK